MANIKPTLTAELSLLQPVPEICSVISAMTSYHPEKQIEILEGVSKAIQNRLQQLKGDESSGKQIR